MVNLKQKCVLLGLCCLLLSACGEKEKIPLVVFAAGSLIEPFGALENAFEAEYPQIDVLPEYHGSIQVIRHATELHETIDVIATADYALIPTLMFQVTDPDTGRAYADWYLKFATNKLGLAYTPQSRYGNEINPENWAEILARPDVRVGIADPRFDPSGYRALIVTKLAESVYDDPNLFGNLFAGQFRLPIKVEDSPAGSLIRVPEVLETRKDAHLVIRGASVQLLALLESGDLDYAFEYESVIQQHGFQLLSLPDSLNLGTEGLRDTYGKATVLLDFQRFASVKPEFKGEQIGYGITIPTNAAHPKEAAQFIAFLLGAQGRKLMDDHHHPLFEVIEAAGHPNLPENLKDLVEPVQ